MVVTRTIATLRSKNIVVELSISKTLVEPDVEMIKANATLKDGSILYISEAVGEGWREYSYHWQRKGELIRRWDNAPHYNGLRNFPHHTHKGNQVLPCDDVNLTDVLAYIEKEIKKRVSNL